jgi:hypothetical protein
MSLFCRHNWKFLKTHTLPSLAMEAKNVGVTFSNGGYNVLRISSKNTYTCNKCGDFKVVTQTNY